MPPNGWRWDEGAGAFLPPDDVGIMVAKPMRQGRVASPVLKAAMAVAPKAAGGLGVPAKAGAQVKTPPMVIQVAVPGRMNARVEKAAPVARSKQRSWQCPKFSGFKGSTAALVLTLLLASVGSGPIADLAAGVASVSKLTGEVSDVAGAAIRAGSNATSQVLHLFVAATSGVANVAAGAWRGVDLRDLNATRRWGRTLADDEIVLAEFLISTQGRKVVRVPAACLDDLLAAILAVGVSLPHHTINSHSLGDNGHYSECFAAVDLLESGFVALSWSGTSVDFVPSWANPFWELIAAPLASERTQVFETVRSVLNQLPAPQHQLQELVDASISQEALVVVGGSRLRRWWRRAIKLCRRGVQKAKAFF